MKKVLLMFGGVFLGMAVSGAVQNVTITADNAYAYNASNRLACDSGSKILVTYSYRADGKTLKESLLDFIDVTPSAAGQPDPWVSIRVVGDGLKNDVDFSAQPYLWLGTTESASAIVLDGVFEPYGDVYQLGYGENVSGEYRGLVVKDLRDNPVSGAPRRVRAAGPGNVLLGGGTYSGGIVAEGPSYLTICSTSDVGTGYRNASVPAITLRNVDGKAARLQLKNVNVVYAEDLEIRIDGVNELHSCGAAKTVYTTLKGPVTGSGQIRLTDQGGVHFTSARNTFDGEIYVSNRQEIYDVEICIGDGVNCSWAGSKITQPSNWTNHIVTVNCGSDFTLDAELSASGGRLVKKGDGTLTLGKAFPRKPIRTDIPVLQILGGTVKRAVKEPADAVGLVEIAAGAKLDLNQVAAPSIWLPFGAGDIVNPAGGAVTLKGPAIEGQVFQGSVEGRVTVEETMALAPWRIGFRTRLGTSLVVASGEIWVDDRFSSPAVEVKSGAGVLFGSQAANDAGGLKMEAWFNGVAWSSDGHAACLEAAVARADSGEKPNVSTNMTVFGDVFASGEANETGGKSGPFRTAFGDTKDHFVAKFTGYFIAEKTGRYDFRIYADDGAKLVLDGTNTVINACAGDGTAALDGSAILEAGRHPVTFYFCEEGGWEVFRVNLKGPDDADYALLPTRLLSTWNGVGTDLGAVTGAGSLRLGEAGAAWPKMDLSGFAGRVVANGPAAAADAGRVAPAGASLHFPGGSDFEGPLWWRAGRTVIVLAADGKPAFDLGGAANANGFVNRTRPLDLSKPFTVSFDFSIHAPWANESSLGDGFALMLHDKVDGTFGDTFGYDCAAKRINNASAYGMQCYLMPDQSHFAWVKDNRHFGNVETNGTYVMKQAKDPAKPFHVTLAWDLEKLVFTIAREGHSPLTMTAAAAAADLAAKFPDGRAYLGVWGRNAGYYCTMLFANLEIDEADAPASEPEAVSFGGTLGVADGMTRVLAVPDVRPVVASPLDVTGAGGLSAPAGLPVQLTSSDWTFALTNETAKLTLAGPFALPSQVEVSLVGEPTAKGRVLADLTGVAGGAPDVVFRLAPDCPKGWSLTYSAGLLKVSSGSGTTIFIR